jgi:sarcosine oxidase delta subunit
MSFLLSCPNCGPRDVNEFGYAGEITVRPAGSPSFRELTSYLYCRRNVAGGGRELDPQRGPLRPGLHHQREAQLGLDLRERESVRDELREVEPSVPPERIVVSRSPKGMARTDIDTPECSAL